MFLEMEIGGPTRSSEACALGLRTPPSQPSSEQMSKGYEENEIPKNLSTPPKHESSPKILLAPPSFCPTFRDVSNPERPTHSPVNVVGVVVVARRVADVVVVVAKVVRPPEGRGVFKTTGTTPRVTESADPNVEESADPNVREDPETTDVVRRPW